MVYPGEFSVAPVGQHIAQTLRRAIASEVVAIFNDRARGEMPVQRRPEESLFGPSSVIWRVHGDVTSMMVGGVSALMLQMLHPGVLAGVWDHSRFREDLNGRLRRTARFIAVTTYGAAAEAEAAIARVRRIHAQVNGALPDGTPYRASDPRLLSWVHVTEATSFLHAWIRYAEPAMPGRERDRYFAEIARIGTALGADPVPTTRAEAARLIADFRSELRADERTREVARILFERPAPTALAQPLQALTMEAGIDLLPSWARRMHGAPATFGRPLIHAGTLGVARTLRWAFT